MQQRRHRARRYGHEPEFITSWRQSAGGMWTLPRRPSAEVMVHRGAHSPFVNPMQQILSPEIRIHRQLFAAPGADHSVT